MTSSTADATVTNLCFHGLGTPDRPLELGEDIHWVPPDLFLRVLDLVADRQDVSISFDDGNESDVTVGLPALVERGLSAEVFSALAGRLDQRGSLECLSVVRRHPTVHEGWVPRHGPHVLAETDSPSRHLGELDDARSRIEEATGVPVDAAACPFGLYDRATLGQLRRRGYTQVMTSDRATARRDGSAAAPVQHPCLRHDGIRGGGVGRADPAPTVDRPVARSDQVPAMSASPKPRALVGFGHALAAIEAVHSLMAGGYTVVLLARRAGTSSRVAHPRGPDRARRPSRGGPDLLRRRGRGGPCVTWDQRRPPSGRRRSRRPGTLCAPFACRVCRATGGPGRPRSGQGQTVGDGARRRPDHTSHSNRRPRLTSVGHAVTGTCGSIRPTRALDIVDDRLVKHPTLTVSTEGDLRRTVGGCTHTVMVQPWLHGVGRGVFGLGDNGRARYLSAHERVRMMNPSGSGSSACTSAEVELAVRRGRRDFGAGWPPLERAVHGGASLSVGGVPYFVEASTLGRGVPSRSRPHAVCTTRLGPQTWR